MGILLKMLINPHQKTKATTLHNTGKSNTKPTIVFNLKSRSPICSCIASICSTTCTILLHTKVKQQTLYSSLNFHMLLKTNLSSIRKFSPKKPFYEWLYDKIVDSFQCLDNDNNQPFHTLNLKTSHPYFFVTIPSSNQCCNGMSMLTYHINIYIYIYIYMYKGLMWLNG